MALINCQECKKDFSNSAKSCPHCGFKTPKKFFKKHIIIIFIPFIILSYMMPKSNNNIEKKSINNQNTIKQNIVKTEKTLTPEEQQSLENEQNQKNIDYEKSTIIETKKFITDTNIFLKKYYAHKETIRKIQSLTLRNTGISATSTDKQRVAEANLNINNLLILNKKAFASVIQQTSMENGFNIYVTSENNNNTLKIKYSLMSDALVYNLVNKQKFHTQAFDAGFKKIIFTDGYNFSTSFNKE